MRGDHLSREIAHRATPVRDAAGLKAPGGHLRSSVPQLGAGNTDPDFVRNRPSITAQVRAVLTVAASQPTAVTSR
ncbi:hypothetical protein ABZS71_20660 [Streptomyces sp. NPDC005393]|uniref:hypothetical protein n=1 Tax=Streptomyces sp. NPDC005393 TaxID=3157041 RepID=UPI0033B9D432